MFAKIYKIIPFFCLCSAIYAQATPPLEQNILQAAKKAFVKDESGAVHWVYDNGRVFHMVDLLPVPPGMTLEKWVISSGVQDAGLKDLTVRKSQYKMAEIASVPMLLHTAEVTLNEDCLDEITYNLNASIIVHNGKGLVVKSFFAKDWRDEKGESLLAIQSDLMKLAFEELIER